jgi:hypothetical protein
MRLRNPNGTVICAPMASGSPLATVSDSSDFRFATPSCLPSPGWQLSIIERVAPSTDGGRFNVQLDGITVGTGLGDQDSTIPLTIAAGSYQVTDSAVNGVAYSDYTTAFGGNCDSSGNVILPAMPGNATCVIQHYTAAASCVQSCNADQNACTEDVTQCTADYNNCIASCPSAPSRAWVTVTVAVNPVGDTGTFDILIDNVLYGKSIGNGRSVGPIAITPADPNDRGPHIVSVGGSASYTIGFAGDCGPTLRTGPREVAVSYGPDFQGTCAVTATRLP